MDVTHLVLNALGWLLLAPLLLGAQGYTVSRTGTFAPPQKPQQTVLLLQNAQNQRPIILFQTKLRVNTDGSPRSYHPRDPRGAEKAINTVCNAIVVKRVGSIGNLCRTEFGTAIGVFERFRDSHYRNVPDGFTIAWENVLPAVTKRGRKVPCVFASGPFAGFFGSLTALKNGVADPGECQIGDQVNPLTVPALVLAGGQNVLKEFGAALGDLVVAFDPKTTRVVSAIVGDTGPDDNLGEGSVFLNMALLGTTDPPKNRADTFRLSIEDTQVLIAILPATRSFQRVRPYTAANIDVRVRQWQQDSGFATADQFLAVMKAFQPRLQ